MKDSAFNLSEWHLGVKRYNYAISGGPGAHGPILCARTSQVPRGFPKLTALKV